MAILRGATLVAAALAAFAAGALAQPAPSPPAAPRAEEVPPTEDPGPGPSPESRKGDVAALLRDLPRDAIDVIRRRIECTRWSGEDASDKRRAREIRQAMRKLHCQALDMQEGILRERYAGAPHVLDALDKAESGDY